MNVQPHLIVDVTLYPTSEGGRKTALRGRRYGCPCKLHKDDVEARDGWLLIEGQPPMFPGETRRLGIYFASEDLPAIFRSAGKFYLWEGHIIGEAQVVPG